MPTNNTYHLVESRWIGKLVGHLSTPSAFVSIDPIGELVSERARIQALCHRLLLEQRAHLTEGHSHVLYEPKDVVEISTLHTLDHAAQFLCRDLVDGVDGERDSIGEIRPDAVENRVLLHRSHHFGLGNIQFEKTRLVGLLRPDVGNPISLIGEFEKWEPCMVASGI